MIGAGRRALIAGMTMPSRHTLRALRALRSASESSTSPIPRQHTDGASLSDATAEPQAEPGCASAACRSSACSISGDLGRRA